MTLHRPLPGADARLPWIDICRGIAILLVVLGHALQFTVANFDENIAFRLIYAVHMPLFICISGYVAPPPRGAWRPFAARRAMQLLLPFIVWLPLNFLAIAYLQRPPGFVPDFAEFVVTVLRNPDAGGLWFLVVLFECHLLLRACSAAGRQHALLACLAALFALNVLLIVEPGWNVIGIGLTRWYFLFFVLGHAARQRGFRVPAALPSALLAVVYLVLVAGWYRKSAVPLDLWPAMGSAALHRLGVQGYHALTATAGICALAGLCAAWVTRRPEDRALGALAWLGNRTLQIYSGHYAFLYLGVAITGLWAIDGVLRIAVVACGALAGALLLARAIEPRVLARKLLYGR
jgi:fucose 4-O-acetylase-like acetyltransferase